MARVVVFLVATSVTAVSASLRAAPSHAHAAAAKASAPVHHAASVPDALPPVEKVLSASSSTLDQMSRQLSEFGTRLLGQAKQERANLASKKADMESKLAGERQMNAHLRKQGQETARQISELEATNKVLHETARGLEDDGDRLRSALETVDAKVDGVRSYVNSSLAAADESRAAYLEVLRTGEEKGSEKDTAAEEAPATDASNAEDADDSSTDAAPAGADADAAGSDASDDGAEESAAVVGEPTAADGEAQALVEIASRHRSAKKAVDSSEDDDAGSEGDEGDTPAAEDGDAAPATADADDASGSDDAAEPAAKAEEDTGSANLITSLSTGLKQLATQDASASEKMEHTFQKKLLELQKERNSILAQQTVLNHTKASEIVLQKKLKLAVKHLKSTKAQLEGRLTGLGQYLRELADFVSQPTAQAERLIPSLTSNVALFLQTAKRAPPMPAVARAPRPSAKKLPSKAPAALKK